MTMTLEWLLGWWNLIFVVPFVLALTYLGIYTVSGLTFGEADADAEFGADADADVDANANVDADPDVDAEIDADAEVEADADADHDAADHGHHHHVGSGHDGSLVTSALTWLGFGRVPLSIVLMVLLLAWGAIGFLVNRAVWESTGQTWVLPLVSVPAAVLGSLLATRGVVRVMGRFLPTDGAPAPRRSDLVGSVGEAMFPIDDRFGMAWVRDAAGQPYQVPCRIGQGAGPVAKGAQVLLVSYDAEAKLYTVIPYDLGTPGSTRTKRHPLRATGDDDVDRAARAGRDDTRARVRGTSS